MDQELTLVIHLDVLIFYQELDNIFVCMMYATPLSWISQFLEAVHLCSDFNLK